MLLLILSLFCWCWHGLCCQSCCYWLGVADFAAGFIAACVVDLVADFVSVGGADLFYDGAVSALYWACCLYRWFPYYLSTKKKATKDKRLKMVFAKLQPHTEHAHNRSPMIMIMMMTNFVGGRNPPTYIEQIDCTCLQSGIQTESTMFKDICTFQPITGLSKNLWRCSQALSNDLKKRCDVSYSPRSGRIGSQGANEECSKLLSTNGETHA